MTPADRSRTSEGGEDARVARTRAAVSRAALHVLTHEDSEALTHAHVAEIAGYSKTTLYTHWPSRVDLLKMALDGLGDLPHQTPTGDLRNDVIGELMKFKQAVVELRLDRVLTAMAQSAPVAEVAEVRDHINREAQQPLRTMLTGRFHGAQLEAAISMLAGVVACPSLMFGTVPEDDIIAAAVDLLLRGPTDSASG